MRRSMSRDRSGGPRPGLRSCATARREDRFGAFAHVWSNYDAAAAMRGTPIIRRGVNSIQLWNDGARWWILSVLWDAVAALT